VVLYRSFRNDDPPGLVRVWNESLTGRGAVPIPTPLALEEYVFAKPYFDPAGLIVAADGGAVVGFAHAGFGASADGARLSTEAGVVCAVAVRPSHRRRGIGSELLRRGEAYLAGRGARAVFAGAMKPLNPFYLGLYGGSESAGFLASDAAAEPFLARHGYAPHATCLVFHRGLDGPINVADARFAAVRRRFDLVVGVRRGVSWWDAATFGPIDPFEGRLIERGNGQVAARASVWELAGYCQRWQAPAIGVLGLEVRADLRRQGLARFLLTELFRRVQEQYFSLVEAQAPERDEAAGNLLRGLGFKQVDVGRTYRKSQ
jgi:ribosomal protein S18 acetylase RimI-like enzyme